MAELNQIQLNGTVYDLEDTTAREKNEVQDNELASLKSATKEQTNYFDAATIENGKRFDSTGTPITDNNCFISDYIPVIPGAKYLKNSPAENIYHRAVIYNASKGVLSPQTANLLEIPQNGAFIRISGALTEINNTAVTIQSAQDVIARNEIKNVGDELKTELDAKPKSVSVTPIYQGDWLTRLLPSACLVIEDKAYLFDGYKYGTEESDNNTVTAHIYDIANNTHISTVEIQGGHANSAAFDGTYIWIAPTLDYETGTSANYLYRYDKNLTEYVKVQTPGFNSLGVSYDWVTHKLYAMGYDKKIYQLTDDGSTITAVTGAVSVPSDTLFNQDFCVWDDRFFISAPGSIVVSGKITQRPVIDAWYFVDAMDQAGRWKLGELEGFEFSPDGQCYCVRVSHIGASLNNGFLTVLPINKSVIPAETASWVSNRYLSVFNYNDNNPLYLLQDEIRSLNQLSAVMDTPSRVNILGDTVVDLGDIYINSDYALCYTCPITVGSFNIQAGNFELYPQGANALFTSTNQGRIVVSRSGQLTILGKNFWVTNGQIVIDVGTWRPTTKIMVMPRNPNGTWVPIVIGTDRIYGAGTFIGNGKNKVSDRNIQRGAFSLAVSNTASTHDVSFVINYSDAPLVLLSIYSDSSSTVDLANIAYWVSARTRTGFTVTAIGKNLSQEQTVYVMWETIDEV